MTHHATKEATIRLLKFNLYWDQHLAFHHYTGCTRCQRSEPCARYHNLAWATERSASALRDYVA